MTVFAPHSTTSQPRRFLLRRKRGWIGVDVGAALTKMAQVERVGGEYRIAARWCLPANVSPNLVSDSQPSDGEEAFAQHLRRARGMFSGRRLAAALSTSYTTHRYMDLPFGENEELRRMVGEEIEADAAAASGERCFDYWASPHRRDASNALVQLSVIDIDRGLSLRLANNLTNAGLDCRLLDGIPCALARAAKMFDPHQTKIAKVIIDIGYSSTVFVAVADGIPAYTRVLRGCGLDAIVRPIQNSLALSAHESQQLVRRMGHGRLENDSPSDAAAQVVHQLISEPVMRLMTEISRTLGYLQHSPTALRPEQIVLAGGGSCLPHLAAQLANEAGIQVVAWQLPAGRQDATNPDDSLFAVAAALSALAWEA